jgi:putative tryptophan/tyrosine transport system permease protein
MSVLILGVFQDALPLIPLLLGIVWSFRYQDAPDFSLAGSFSIGSALTAVALQAGLHPLPAVTLGLTAGAVVGLAMGTLCNFMRVNALLAGVLVLFMSYACSLALTQGTIRVPAERNPFEHLYTSYGEGSIVALLAGSAVVLLAVNWWLLASEWGCAFRALESRASGRTFLNSLGISPEKLSCAGFAMGGTLAALSGVAVALKDGQATSSLGTETFIDAVPAYLLGTLLFERRAHSSRLESGVARLVNTIRFATPSIAASLGVLIFFLLVNLSLAFVPFPWLPKLLLGAGITGLLGVPSLIADRRLNKKIGTQTKTNDKSGELQVSNLSVSYPTIRGPVPVIRAGNFRIQAGSIVQVGGTNGSGKTSLLKALCGRLDCEGEFKIPIDKVLQEPGSGRERLVLYVPQDPSEDLVERLTLAEHVSLCSLRSTPSALRPWTTSVGSGLARLPVHGAEELGAALPGAFSGGERRRILLGLLAVRGVSLPRVICLDEPFSYLDREGANYCLQLMHDLAASKRIVILTDHGPMIDPAPQMLSDWGSIKEGLGQDAVSAQRRHGVVGSDLAKA